MNQATTKSGGEERFLVSLGTSSAIPRILPGQYGGRELEGGGNSPSPYSSPLKGEETSPRIATPSARNDSKKGARNDREGRIATPSARNDVGRACAEQRIVRATNLSLK